MRELNAKILEIKNKITDLSILALKQDFSADQLDRLYNTGMEAKQILDKFSMLYAMYLQNRS